MPIPGESDELRVSENLELARQTCIKQLSLIPQQEANRMAYKDMNYVLYLVITLVLFSLEMLLAVLIDDISTVFEFASAFAVTFLAFWFPSMYYLMSEKKYGTAENASSLNHCTAIIFIFIGVFNFLVGMSAAVINIID